MREVPVVPAMPFAGPIIRVLAPGSARPSPLLDFSAEERACAAWGMSPPERMRGEREFRRREKAMDGNPYFPLNEMWD